MTYIGAGMICSHLVNLSLLLGAVLSWGIMWPLILERKGSWFPATLSESSMRSLTGYKVCSSTFILPSVNCYYLNAYTITRHFWLTMQVFVSIALILGDGLYNFLKILVFTGRSIYTALNKKNSRTSKFFV